MREEVGPGAGGSERILNDQYRKLLKKYAREMSRSSIRKEIGEQGDGYYRLSALRGILAFRKQAERKTFSLGKKGSQGLEEKKIGSASNVNAGHDTLKSDLAKIFTGRKIRR